MLAAARKAERLSTMILCVLLSSLPCLAAGARGNDLLNPRFLAVDDTVVVPTGVSSVEIPFSEVQANDSLLPGAILTIARQPSQGNLQVWGSNFVYTLDDEFRSLRHDSFAYTLMAPGGGSSTATVHLYRMFPSAPVLFQGFEYEDPINYLPGPGFQENLIISTAAALVGNFGLRVFAPFGEAEPAFVTFVPNTDTSDDGGTTLLGCGLSNISEGRAVLLTLGLSGQGVDDAVARIAIERLPGQVPRLFAEVRRATGSGYTSSPGVAVETEVSNLAIEWFDGGLTLEVDGLATTNLDPANAPIQFTDVQLGILSASGFDGELYLDFDQIEFFLHPEVPPPAPLLLTDDFDTAGFSPWAQVVGSGITESNVNPITGTQSLRLALGLGDGYLLGATPASTERFGARFRLDTAGISLAAGDILQVLALGTGPMNGLGNPRYSLEVEEAAGVPRIRLAYLHADITTPWIDLPVTTIQHAALQYGVASAPGLANGYLRLWIDGAIAGQFLELGNSGEIMGWVHLGAKGVDPLSVGALIFDDFEAWE